MSQTITVRLTRDLAEWLDATAAKRKGRSKSAVLRTALEQYLHGDQSAEANSFLEKAADVIGSVRGPRDLSTNPKHLKGFGE